MKIVFRNYIIRTSLFHWRDSKINIVNKLAKKYRLYIVNCKINLKMSLRNLSFHLRNPIITSILLEKRVFHVRFLFVDFRQNHDTRNT